MPAQWLGKRSEWGCGVGVGREKAPGCDRGFVMIVDLILFLIIFYERH